MAKKDSATFLQYAGCSTCRKAKQWLDHHKVDYQSVPIVEKPPSVTELARLVKQSGLPVQKWFNTSGQSYRALIARIGKEGLAKLDDAAKLKLLAADGKMIKRPVLITHDKVLVGLDETGYRSLAR
jgi:arsenate reductase